MSCEGSTSSCPFTAYNLYKLAIGSEEPDTFIDITEAFSLKLAALMCHASQVGQRAEVLKKWVEERAAQVGESQGIPLAEAFRRIEIIY